MIKVEEIDTWGFEHAIRGMRNPMNSWNLSDTMDDIIGDRDLKLMKKLIVSGSEHRKFMRQIFISMDITAPLYWWKEFDTYKVGTVANSCSTMHKIHSKEFELDDFSHEHLTEINKAVFISYLETLNLERNKFLETKNKDFWWQMIQLLPSSYNQKRTITMDYENVLNMIKHRRNHKLDEWREFVNILMKLPYINIYVEALDHDIS